MTWGTECDVSSVSVCAIALRGTEYRLPEYDGGTELLPSARRSLDRVTDVLLAFCHRHLCHPFSCHPVTPAVTRIRGRLQPPSHPDAGF
jgi:hypothetical protein